MNLDRSDDLNIFNPPAELSLEKLQSLPENLSAATTSSARADERVVHVLNRLGFGPRPGDIRNVQAMGLQRYIQQQLNPKSIPMPSWIEQGLANAKTLNKSPYALYQRNHPRNIRLQQLRKEEKRGFQKKGKLSKEQRKAKNKAEVKRVIAKAAKESRAERRKIQAQVQLPLIEAANARLIRAINSPRQLEEVMVNFWFNHFNVSKRKGYGRIWTGIFDEQAIRPNVMGSFRELLGATAHHPAMLYYLDNVRSKANAINENYARELLELHTLGVDGGYTLKDIQEVARVFTGWGYTSLNIKDPRPRAEKGQHQDFFFNRNVHDFGNKTILGQTFTGSGKQEGDAVLDLLARHPSTAKHIAFKLSQYFVADTPPPSLVSKLATSFQSSNGNITTVLTTLFSSSEFWDSRYFNQKFKTPYEYLISACRATGQKTVDTRKIEGMLQQLGMPLYGCETPDGYKNTQAAWLSPEAIMRRISFATAIADGALGGNSQPASPNQLAQTLGYALSGQTLAVLQESPPPLQATAILGSPEMMKR